jgi:meiotically up-regulated gene 157 (Mug157) protein
MAVVQLRKLAAMLRELANGNTARSARAQSLAQEIDRGIQTHGRTRLPGLEGDLYAYEV